MFLFILSYELETGQGLFMNVKLEIYLIFNYNTISFSALNYCRSPGRTLCDENAFCKLVAPVIFPADLTPLPIPWAVNMGSTLFRPPTKSWVVDFIQSMSLMEKGEKKNFFWFWWKNKSGFSPQLDNQGHNCTAVSRREQ